MEALRVLIVDDEPLALDRLTDLLHQIEGIELVGSIASGSDVVAAIESHRPDLVLLDVEMPRIDGFDVIEILLRQDWLGNANPPLFCFVTAYPQFASDAFETGALDFLCKPVRLPRLEKTIARARNAIEQREATERLRELSGQLDQLRETRLPAEDQVLWVHQRGEMIRLEVSALDWIEAEGEYVRLHFAEKSFLLRTSISALSEQLEGRGFVRLHRSATVNRQRVQAVRRRRSGLSVVLSSGVELPVGRKFRRSVEAVTDVAGN